MNLSCTESVCVKRKEHKHDRNTKRIMNIITKQTKTIMTEFVFRVKLRANEKLDAFAKIKNRFPSSSYKLISIGGEEVQD